MAMARPTETDRYAWPRLLVWLVAGSVVLTLASLFAVWWAPTPPIYHYVEVTSEVNLPMWWTVLLLIAGATLMLVVAASAASRRVALAWRVAAVIALLMSLDDATMLHEKLGAIVERFWADIELTFTWVVLGVPIALVVVLLAWWAARRLPRVSGRLLLGGFVVFLGAAVGFELIAEAVLGTDPHWFLYRFVYHLEEGLEMTGAALLVVAPLSDLRRVRTLSGAPAEGSAVSPSTREESAPPLA
ncbi:hypothetical protein [Kocuria sp. NPDC057446]|uniref:hypothetical protein n=1 Tax=Kocuria sp. NPDC057446 TaxID=3346137 RepID=UPI003680841A